MNPRPGFVGALAQLLALGRAVAEAADRKIPVVDEVLRERAAEREEVARAREVLAAEEARRRPVQRQRQPPPPR